MMRSYLPHRFATVLAALVLPSLAVAQGQIDTGHANDANTRYGSGGRNNNSPYAANPNYLTNNNGNRIITGNVTMGREFRDNIGYSDPTAFRGSTAGTVSDNFVKNSAGVATAGTSEVVPNRSVPFYGASQTVQPPPGFQLTANKGGFVPPPPPGQRDLSDQRLGVIDLNRPMTNVPVPGELLMRGSLNPQNAAQQAGYISGSTLYGVREWNPQDPADRVFLENIMSRQSGAFDRAQQYDPRQIQKMRDELQKALDPDKAQQQQQNPNAPKPQDSLNNGPIGSTLESPASAFLTGKPLNDQVKGQPLAPEGMSTEQGTRYNVIGARKTSTQYTELSKRLEQYYADRRKTDADFARDFNAELKAKHDADAKAAAIAKAKTPGGENPAATAKPATTGTPEDPTKPKVKKPAPVKITHLSEGVRGEGLSNVLKKAETLMKEGKFTTALDQYDAAEAVTPNNPLIWLGRANAELGAGFFVRADEHVRQALTSDKALLMGQYDLTGMLGEERLGKIVTELKDIANKDNKPMAVFLLAYIAYNTGHERQALGYVELAEKRAGEDQAAFYKMLRQHWALPDDAGAKPLNK